MICVQYNVLSIVILLMAMPLLNTWFGLGHMQWIECKMCIGSYLYNAECLLINCAILGFITFPQA